MNFKALKLLHFNRRCRFLRYQLFRSMATYTYNYYESGAISAQRVHVASDSIAGDNHQMLFKLDILVKYILCCGHGVGVQYAIPSPWTTLVWSDKLLQNNGQFLSRFLFKIGFPGGYQLPVIQQMCDKAARMVAASTGDRANLGHMEVIISTVTHVISEDDDSLTPLRIQPWSFEPGGRQPSSFEPATRLSIENLERFRVTDGNPTRECTICMEELAGGMDASRLPCSHVFHADCIRHWLEKSHCCPLC